ncbi:DUF4132 domain-containing protein [Polymorphospora sp. NPDC050346]|uniref:DUF4132 domain-containing protein n=1 Tax=Polymorphospora sp. NPDC050346 TaxID=3155780 RepID=UPI00340D2FA5
MTDEDQLVIPRAWYRSIHPRRDGAPVGYEPDPDWQNALRRLVAQRPSVRDALRHHHTPAEVASAGLAWFDETGEETPLGAAAVATALIAFADRRDPDYQPIADAWIGRHGLMFAVRAAAELAGLGYGGWSRSGPVHRDREGGEVIGSHWLARGHEQVLGRVRAALACESTDEYTAAVAALSGYRDGSLRQRIVTSFLVPGREDWVDADVRALAGIEDSSALLLLASATTVAQVHLIEDALAVSVRAALFSSRMLHTVAEGLGAAGADLFVHWLDDFYADAATRWVLLSVVAALPGDHPFQLLLNRLNDRHVAAAVVAAADRFPHRALRLLATAPKTDDLLRRHLLRHPGLADELPPGLPAAASARIHAARAVPTEPTAPAQPLPALLVTPPWTVRRKTPRPVVLTGLRCADEPKFHPDSADRVRIDPVDLRHDVNPALVKAQIRSGTAVDWQARHVLETEPPQIAVPLLAVWRPRELWGLAWWLPRLTTRFGVDAYPLVLDIARRSPAEAGPQLARFTSPDIALLMADWLARLKTVHKLALAWLRRHPAAAARALVPVALSKPGVARRQAERALVAIAGAGHRDTVLAAAASYGPPAAAAITDLLDADPLDGFPARIPRLPDWVDVATMPPVRLRDGTGVLSPDAAGHVVTMLAISKPDEPYAGLAVVVGACTPDSLAAFAWELLERWLRADAAPAHGWTLNAQALLGDDTTAGRLGAVVRRWPHEGAHQRTAAGLDALARLGTEAALLQLHSIATTVKAKAVRARATANLQEAAQQRGLSAEQLADRLVPDLGLGPDGTLVLDYGPRRFVVRLDEQLRPLITDGDGSHRKGLPKPAAADDPQLAAAALDRFAALRQGLRAFTRQVHRLEEAMVRQRRWTGAEFRQLLVDHPVLGRVVPRLVWALFKPSGEVVGALRVAEDRTFADLDDETITVADDACVGVAHPVQLGADVSTWADLFDDYQLLQPFPQLGREVHGLTVDERSAVRLARFDGVKASTVRLLALERRGWRRSGEDGGRQHRMECDLPDGGRVVVALVPGIMMGAPDHHPEQTFEDVWICRAGGDEWRDPHDVTFGELDPVSASELLRDLTEATG